MITEYKCSYCYCKFTSSSDCEKHEAECKEALGSISIGQRYTRESSHELWEVAAINEFSGDVTLVMLPIGNPYGQAYRNIQKAADVLRFYSRVIYKPYTRDNLMQSLPMKQVLGVSGLTIKSITTEVNTSEALVVVASETGARMYVPVCDLPDLFTFDSPGSSLPVSNIYLADDEKKTHLLTR